MSRVFALLVALAACGSPKPPPRPPENHVPVEQQPATPPASKAADSIGTATMLDDGTIQMHLIARGQGGMIGDALISYAPTHKDYAMVLKHLGGMTPGESKPVPPFPD